MHRPPRGPKANLELWAGSWVKFTLTCVPVDPDPATPRPVAHPETRGVPRACLPGCSSGIVAGPPPPLPRPHPSLSSRLPHPNGLSAVACGDSCLAGACPGAHRPAAAWSGGGAAGRGARGSQVCQDARAGGSGQVPGEERLCHRGAVPTRPSPSDAKGVQSGRAMCLRWSEGTARPWEEPQGQRRMQGPEVTLRPQPRGRAGLGGGSPRRRGLPTAKGALHPPAVSIKPLISILTTQLIRLRALIITQCLRPRPPGGEVY